MNENLSLTHEELLICERLRSLRMSGMADAFESQMLDPNADLAPFIERFTEIVNHEWQIRYDKKFKRYLKQAHLRYPDADLDETIYDPARKLDTDAIERLATCHWIDEGKNLLITGMTSSGKTHLSNALCISALRQLKTVRYIRANTLMLELEQARLKSTYLEYVTALSKLDLLAIDDFGLMELDLDKCRDLFEVIDGRDGRRSTIIISQFPIKSWFDLFREHTYADACLARITDKRHSYRLEMMNILALQYPDSGKLSTDVPDVDTGIDWLVYLARYSQQCQAQSHFVVRSRLDIVENTEIMVGPNQSFYCGTLRPDCRPFRTGIFKMNGISMREAEK